MCVEILRQRMCLFTVVSDRFYKKTAVVAFNIVEDSYNHTIMYEVGFLLEAMKPVLQIGSLG